MTRALCLITRWIAVAHDRWRAEVAKRRPLSAEIDALKETVARLRSENELLRGRLRRVPLRRRPRYGGYERLLILLHQARYGLSLRATARAFVLSGQTIINWHKDIAAAAAARRADSRPQGRTARPGHGRVALRSQRRTILHLHPRGQRRPCDAPPTR